MKQLILGFLFLLQLESVAYSQKLKASDLESLGVTWEVVENDLKDGTRSRSILTLTNHSKKPFPATGWTVFFNSGNFSAADSTQAKIKLVNGDLQALTPGANFGTIPAGGEKKIAISGASIRNVTEFPVGFYIGINDQPEWGHSLDVKFKTSVSTGGNDLAVANRVYKQNEQIKDIPVQNLTKIFPTPVAYREKDTNFVLDAAVTVTADPSFKNEADHLITFVTGLTGRKPVVQSKGAGKAIVIAKIAGLRPEEYRLSVGKEKITISATTPAGAFYGVQSLKTLVSPGNPSGKPVTIQGVEVTDDPRFPHRAFMLDVGRNFHSKAEVLKILDLMALYKLNVFHFHFSEDEGWRLEIPALPELTSVGSKRAPTSNSKQHLPPSFGSGADTINSGTGFYSKADFIQILQFAKARHIKVIPEIESPGHARAAIKAMDARYDRLLKAGQEAEARKYLLRDPADKSMYRSVQGWDDNVINVAMPSVYTFMETVVDELVKMYAEAGAPLETIHFGGDEVPGGVWEKSPAVNALIGKDENLKTPNDLWYFYFKNINEILNKRNLYLYGWEEAGLVKTYDGNLAWTPNTELAKKKVQVDVWNNLPGSGAEDLAYRMANKGIKVVLAAVTNFYFDLAYNQSFDEPGLYWGGYVDIDKPFYFIPFNYLKNLKDNEGNLIDKSVIKGTEPLTDFGKSNIVGLQGALWSENIRDPERLEYMLLPKLLGLAERAWAKEPQWALVNNQLESDKMYQKAWSEFINVTGKRELPRLDEYAGGFHYRVPTPGALIRNGQVEANVQFPNFAIRYTIDGSEPNLNSPIYRSPIKAKGVIKLKAFNLTGRSSHTLTVRNE